MVKVFCISRNLNCNYSGVDGLLRISAPPALKILVVKMIINFRITDNGTGIRKEDMSIVCERFTTSKLKTFADLSNISTYGFRGEALASISHVARLTILTRTRDTSCGHKAEFQDGKIVDKLKPSAANPGTQITVQDLFFNVPTRRKALKSATDEYSRVYDVMSKYAVHNSGISFTLKKIGDTGIGLRTQTDADTKANIAAIFGSTIARELIPFEIMDKESIL